jgi:hypothetical protein
MSITESAQNEISNRSTGCFLDSEQRQYGRNRVKNLASTRAQALREGDPLPFNGVRPTLDSDGMLQQIKCGIATLIPLEDIKKAKDLPGGANGSWASIWKFHPTPEQTRFDEAKAKVDKMVADVFAERDAAIDDLMLGTGSKATQIIAAFVDAPAAPVTPQPSLPADPS